MPDRNSAVFLAENHTGCDSITATPVISIPRQYIETLLAGHRHFKEQGSEFLGDASVVYEFLLANGQEFRGTPWTKLRGRGYRKQTLGYCFQNAWNYSLVFDDLTYYEGYAFCGLISVHHAWCIDSNGLVVDPTWRKKHHAIPETAWEYFGVGFDSSVLNSWMQQKKLAGVLYDLNYNSDVTEFVVTA